MKQSDEDQTATKNDLNSMRKEMMKDIEAMFHTFMQMIFERFTMQDAELAKKADKADITRLENKLDTTVDQGDDHEGRITNLEAKPA